MEEEWAGGDRPEPKIQNNDFGHPVGVFPIEAAKPSTILSIIDKFREKIAAANPIAVPTLIALLLTELLKFFPVVKEILSILGIDLQ